MKVKQEYMYGAPSRCHAGESTQPEADGGIVTTELPEADSEIERHRSPQGRLPRAEQGFSPRFSSRA
jgi:hypothetical protein